MARPVVAGLSPAHADQIQSAADITREFIKATKEAEQAVRGLQAAFDETAASQTAESIRRLHQALDELGGWLRANPDLLAAILALIQAGAAEAIPEGRRGDHT